MTSNCKTAIIDLNSGEKTIKDIPQKLRNLYLGGRGIGMYLLYNLLEPGIDPLGPENVLILSAGLLTGTPLPSAACTHVAGKSPLGTGCKVHVIGHRI